MAFALAAGAGVALGADNNHWTGNQFSSNWADPLNWELAASPTVVGSRAQLQAVTGLGKSADIVIDGTAESAFTLDVSGSSAGDVSLTIKNGGSLVTTQIGEPFGIGNLNGTGTVTVETTASDSTFVKSGSFTLGSSPGAGNPAVDGTLNLGAGTFEGTHMNIGHFSGPVRGSGFVNLSGTGTLSAISEFNIWNNAVFNQTGFVNFDGGGTIKVTPSLQNLVHGYINAGLILANGAATTFPGGDIVESTDGSDLFYNLDPSIMPPDPTIALWKTTYGDSVTSGSGADVNNNSLIEGADFLDLQQSGASVAVSSAVPEPVSLALIALGLGGLGVIVKRRR